jgi:hypothetical protein
VDGFSVVAVVFSLKVLRNSVDYKRVGDLRSLLVSHNGNFLVSNTFKSILFQERKTPNPSERVLPSRNQGHP